METKGMKEPKKNKKKHQTHQDFGLIKSYLNGVSLPLEEILYTVAVIYGHESWKNNVSFQWKSLNCSPSDKRDSFFPKYQLVIHFQG